MQYCDDLFNYLVSRKSNKNMYDPQSRRLYSYIHNDIPHKYALVIRRPLVQVHPRNQLSKDHPTGWTLFISFVIRLDLRPQSQSFHGGKNDVVSVFLAAGFSNKNGRRTSPSVFIVLSDRCTSQDNISRQSPASRQSRTYCSNRLCRAGLRQTAL